MTRILIVIPARGGSKGIPRKNLRALGGRPLLAYTVATALASRHEADVFVSSEDDEILNLAAKLGAQTHIRNAELAADEATLDQTIVAAFPEIAATTGEAYEAIVTLQPTSPLLTTASLDAAVDMLLGDDWLETVLSAIDDRHLRWTERDGRYAPLYEARVNRQFLGPTFRETGGLIICRPSTLARGSRIGTNVSLVPLSGGEAIDIDSREDWALCEWYLSHRDVIFAVAGYREIGLGHVRNVLTIANELVRHRVRFLVTRPSDLAEQVIAAHHYEVHRQRTDDLVAEILDLGGDAVINDRLDTAADEIARLKAAGLTVINFEDLGTGTREADLVVNAIYPEREALPNHHFGASFFCLPSEFALTRPREVAPKVTSVLVTFGGVDPANLTRRVVEAIHPECVRRGIRIDVIAGTGYREFESLAEFAAINVERAIVDMADRMRAADIAFTSAGRTVFEVAAIGTPTIILAQNSRELTHAFAAPDHGFVHLGLGSEASTERIREAFVELVESAKQRREMQRRMLDNELRSGTARVVRLIEGTLEKHGTR